MPFKSQAQRAFLYAKDPKLAKEFEAKTKDKPLPVRAKKDQRHTAVKKLPKGSL